jgi:hypothetical protein
VWMQGARGGGSRYIALQVSEPNIAPRLGPSIVISLATNNISTTLSENFDRKRLEELLMITYSPGSILSYPDCFYVDYIKSTEGDPGGGEC